MDAHCPIYHTHNFWLKTIHFYTSTYIHYLPYYSMSRNAEDNDDAEHTSKGHWLTSVVKENYLQRPVPNMWPYSRLNIFININFDNKYYPLSYNFIDIICHTTTCHATTRTMMMPNLWCASCFYETELQHSVPYHRQLKFQINNHIHIYSDSEDTTREWGTKIETDSSVRTSKDKKETKRETDRQLRMSGT